MKNEMQKVKRAIAVVKREDGRIGMITRVDEDKCYLSLPTGYVSEGEFVMEAFLADSQKLKLVETEEIIKCRVEEKNDDELCYVTCRVLEEEEGIGEYEYRMTWLDAEEVFTNLRKAITKGDMFFNDLNMSESSMYALMAYYMSRS